MHSNEWISSTIDDRYLQNTFINANETEVLHYFVFTTPFAATIALLVEIRVSAPKVADPWFDSQTGNALLRTWGRHFTLISHWGQIVYLLWWPSLTRLANKSPKSALRWCGHTNGRVPGSYELHLTAHLLTTPVCLQSFLQTAPTRTTKARLFGAIWIKSY